MSQGICKRQQDNRQEQLRKETENKSGNCHSFLLILWKQGRYRNCFQRETNFSYLASYTCSDKYIEIQELYRLLSVPLSSIPFVL